MAGGELCFGAGEGLGSAAGKTIRGASSGGSIGGGKGGGDSSSEPTTYCSPSVVKVYERIGDNLPVCLRLVIFRSNDPNGNRVDAIFLVGKEKKFKMCGLSGFIYYPMIPLRAGASLRLHPQGLGQERRRDVLRGRVLQL